MTSVESRARAGPARSAAACGPPSRIGESRAASGRSATSARPRRSARRAPRRRAAASRLVAGELEFRSKYQRARTQVRRAHWRPRPTQLRRGHGADDELRAADGVGAAAAAVTHRRCRVRARRPLLLGVGERSVPGAQIVTPPRCEVLGEDAGRPRRVRSAIRRAVMRRSQTADGHVDLAAHQQARRAQQRGRAHDRPRRRRRRRRGSTVKKPVGCSTSSR